MQTVLETATKFFTRYRNSLIAYPNTHLKILMRNSLIAHPNTLAKDLSNPIPENPLKQLKIKWCRELLFE